jgi:hypothetical protein
MTYGVQWRSAPVLALLLVIPLAAAPKPDYTIYTDAAAFQRAAGPTATETFESYSTSYCGDGSGGTTELQSPTDRPGWVMRIEPLILRPGIPNNKFLCIGYDLMWVYPGDPAGNRVLAWTYPGTWPPAEYNIVLTLAAPTTAVAFNILTQGHNTREIWVPELGLRASFAALPAPVHHFIGVVAGSGRSFSTLIFVNSSTDANDTGISLDDMQIGIRRGMTPIR